MGLAPTRAPTTLGQGTIADVFESRVEPQAPATAEQPAELDEVFEAARTYSRVDRGDSESLRLTRGFEPILEALNTGLPEDQQFVDPGLWIRLGGNLESAGGELTRRPSRKETWDPRTWVRDRVTVREQMERIFGEIRTRRAKDPGFLPGVPDTWQAYRQQLLDRDKAERAEAAGTLARSPGGFVAGVVGFAGGAREIMADPLNIASLPLGGFGGGKLVTIAAREALINGAIEAIQIPQMAANRELVGDELTAGEAAFNVGTAAAIGGAFPFAIRGGIEGGRAIGRGYDWTVGKVFAAMPETVQAKWAGRMTVADMPADEFFNSLSHADAADFARDTIGAGNLTPEQRAAVNTLEAAELDGATTPFVPTVAGDTEHAGRLSVAIQQIIDQNRPPIGGSPSGAAAGGRAAASVNDAAGAPLRPGEASTGARPQSIVGRAVQAGRAAFETVKSKIRVPESAGNDQATNLAGSSASGRYQFIESTFKGLYRRVFGGGENAAWSSKRRFDPAVQERLMDALLEENAAILERAGIQATTGNLYLAHFAGADRAAKLLKADPAAPVSRYFNETEIRQNSTYLGGGKSVSEAIAVIYGKVGGSAASVRASGAAGAGSAIDGADDAAIALLRVEAARLSEVAIGETPLATGGTLPAMRSVSVRPDQLVVDAERFQFKGGGDEFGVTERLRGVTEWNPIYAGRVVVWEDAGGKLFVADGHQRVGLARRLERDNGQEIQLEGIVLRESEGVSAEDARTWAALKNIAEGTGTAVDAAKVIRQTGPEVLAHLPPKSALVRDGAALSRLSDEAFGAVYNDVISSDIAAVVGHLAPDDPDGHAGLIDLLVKLAPANRGQAESIVRQAIAAGFHKTEQAELFGTREVTSSLFLERAKVLERGLANLRKLKGVFGVASKNADALEGAGSKIARSQAEQEAARNAQAIEIVSRLAFSKGPVADALNSAAARLAGGERLSDVVEGFVADVRRLELEDLSRAGTDDSGRLAPDGAGRGGDAGGEGEPLSGQSADQEQPSLLELEQATERFSDPNGPAAKEQADSLVHDFKAAIDEEQLVGATDDEWLNSLSDREVAEIFTGEVVDEQLNALALRLGRELELEGGDDALDELIDAAMGPLAGDRDKLAKAVDKAFADGRLPYRDLGEPELIEPELGAPSKVVPVPEAPVKSADYAGKFIEPAEATARVEGWKAEAARIGRESPPPPGSIILSLFDASGSISRPYREMGYEVVQLDAKGGHDLLRNMGHYLNAIEELKAKGGRVVGVLAQPPCTTFAGSGARWWDPRHNRNWGNAVEKMWGKWATKFFKSPVEYNQYLVAATEEFIAKSAPDFFLIENPRGRIAKLNGLPKPLLTVEPHHFGDPYTKNTSLYGKFNAELPTANVDPVEGSRMHKLRSSAEKDDGLRSLTPEGFAYAFALANRPGTEGTAGKSPASMPDSAIDAGGEGAGAALEAKIAADPAAARAEYEAIEGDLSGSSEGGRILNTDLARELSPEYRADRSRSAEVHEPASAFIKRLYAEKLAEDPPAGRDREVLFTAGGTGAGKSTGLKQLKKVEGENAGIVYDTNMNGLASARAKIDQALEAGWQVKIVYTYREPVEALTAGALTRAERMGRTVPLTAHVDTHVGARQTMDELAELYKDDPRVVLRAIDNSRGKNNAEIVPLEKLPDIDQVGLYERLEAETRAAFERGDISEQTLRGFLAGREGRVSPDPRDGSGRDGGAPAGQPEQADVGPLDRGAATDPNIADRQRRAALLASAGPMRAPTEQDGTMGLGLFDAADEPALDFGSMTFRLDDEGDEISGADLLAELDGDEAAIAAIRGCL